jgi:hypothetical protein
LKFGLPKPKPISSSSPPHDKNRRSMAFAISFLNIIYGGQETNNHDFKGKATRSDQQQVIN